MSDDLTFEQTITEMSKAVAQAVPIASRMALVPAEHSRLVWGELKNARSELHPVPEFRPEWLPESLRAWAEDRAERLQVPLDYPAVVGLAVFGTVIGLRCAIRPRQYDDWSVHSNLWGALIGPPSTLKSQVLKGGITILKHLESLAEAEFETRHLEFRAEQEEFEARRKAQKKEFEGLATQKDDGACFDEIKRAYVSTQAPIEPRPIRFYTSDCTVEKLVEILQGNPQGILIYRDELLGLLASFNRPGRESDRQFYLEGWDGSGTYTSDRIGRGTTKLKKMGFSLLGCFVPGKLQHYIEETVNGDGNDGFFQRLQLAVYPDRKKGSAPIDRLPDRSALERLLRIAETLAFGDYVAFGAECDEERGIHYFRFSPEAQSFFDHYFSVLQPKLEDESLPEILREHLGKFRSLVPAIALIIHLCNSAEGLARGPISKIAVAQACEWADYLEEHAKRIYGMAVHPLVRAAEELKKRIVRGDLTDGFSARDAYRPQWQGLRDPKIVEAACSELVEDGWLCRVVTGSAKGRKRQIIYYINPKVHHGKMASSCP